MESNDKLEQLLRQMYAEEPRVDVSEEWRKFEATHFPKRTWAPVMKWAAMLIGILLLSGISYAAVHIVKSINRTAEVVEDLQSETAEPRIYNSQSSAESADSMLTAEPKTFENVPLKDIVQEMAAYYRATVDIKNAETAGLRLYYPWNPQMPLMQVVEELSRFEKVELTLKDNQITIE